MIICSCNVITTKAIMAAVDEIRAADPDMLITPGLIYKVMNVKPNCGVCLCHICELVHNADAPSPPRLAAHVCRPSGKPSKPQKSNAVSVDTNLE